MGPSLSSSEQRLMSSAAGDSERPSPIWVLSKPQEALLLLVTWDAPCWCVMDRRLLFPDVDTPVQVLAFDTARCPHSTVF